MNDRTLSETFSEEHVVAAWELLAALEVDDLDRVTEIAMTFDPLELQKGLAIVAQCLLVSIRHHAGERDCGCGTVEWLEAQALGMNGETDG